MRALQFELDESARALYITFSTNEIVTTVEGLPDHVFLDLDKDQNIVGVEILGVEATDLPELIHQIEAVLDEVQEATGRELAFA